MAALDDLLPDFDWRERHERFVPVPPEQAVATMLALPAVPDRAVRALFRVRGLRGPGRLSIGEAFAEMGFERLHETPTELVVGASGRPWRPRGDIRPFHDPAPGTVRVAADVRAVAAGPGSMLSTETRIQAVDGAARSAFGRYWRVVRPFSGLIRRRWLLAASRALPPQ